MKWLFLKPDMLPILKTNGFINILKASLCHSSLLKDNKNFNLFKENHSSYSNFSCHINEQAPLFLQFPSANL